MIADRMRLLGLVLGALVLVLVLEWVWPSGAGGAGQTAGLHLLHGGPKASLQSRAVGEWAASVLARPLFSISRRPPRPEARADGAAAPEARLSGILIGHFGRRAIFAPDGGGKPLVLGEGAMVNQSTITRIEPTQVVLASGAILVPSFDKNRVPPAAFTPPFQPGVANFQPTPFPNGQMPGAAFPGQRSVMPPPAAPEDDNPDGATPQQANPVPIPGVPQPVPVFRGPMIPQRRE